MVFTIFDNTEGVLLKAYCRDHLMVYFLHLYCPNPELLILISYLMLKPGYVMP